MVPYRKKLIEVGLPLVAINAESAREKSIRHGHPSTLHLWWARRPLAACRAVLFSSLVDDPDSDPAFHKADGSVEDDRAGLKRADLFNFIEELVMWENSNNVDVIRTARAEIARCVASRLIETGAMKKGAVVGPKTTAYDLVTSGHCRPIPMGVDKKVGRVRFSFEVAHLPPAEVVNAFLAEHAPPVLDPFAGGGSIPLEAQRLGLRAFASDLNPVPVLINKALIEIPPKFAGRPPVNPASRAAPAPGAGPAKSKKKQGRLLEHDWPGATGLAQDVRYYGQWMRDEAEKRVGYLYPKVEVTAEMTLNRPDLLPYVGQHLTVIAWLWARTVVSPNPACNGAKVPLVRSFCLAAKKLRKAWVVPVVNSGSTGYQFMVRVGAGEAPNGTVNRNGANCILSGATIPLDYIRDEGKAGRLGARMLAIVCEGKSERVYLSPIKDQEDNVARLTLPKDIPDTDLPKAALGFRVQNYGMVKHRHLFTDRQMIAMTTFCDMIKEVRHLVDEVTGGNTDYASAVATFLALGVGRCADFWNTMATWSWQPKNELVGHAFGRQALPITWDFGEINPFSDSGGNFSGNLEFTVKALERTPASGIGIVSQCDALAIGGNGYCLSTDPPYYDNVPYADLSDFFYIWLRRSLSDVYPEILRTYWCQRPENLWLSHSGMAAERMRAIFLRLECAGSLMVCETDAIPQFRRQSIMRSSSRSMKKKTTTRRKAAATKRPVHLRAGRPFSRVWLTHDGKSREPGQSELSGLGGCATMRVTP
jgi:putative DNA methylase